MPDGKCPQASVRGKIAVPAKICSANVDRDLRCNRSCTVRTLLGEAIEFQHVSIALTASWNIPMTPVCRTPRPPPNAWLPTLLRVSSGPYLARRARRYLGEALRLPMGQRRGRGRARRGTFRKPKTLSEIKISGVGDFGASTDCQSDNFSRNLVTRLAPRYFSSGFPRSYLTVKRAETPWPSSVLPERRTIAPFFKGSANGPTR